MGRSSLGGCVSPRYKKDIISLLNVPGVELYLFNLVVIATTGRILPRLMPEGTPGLILEMPPYRVPTLKNVLSKSWLRV
jgi:Fe2+ transport system protein B